jgi:iduronate 2-sulfatase
MGYSIRTQQFRYIQWNNFETGEILATELYDHYSDPVEMENLALDENYMGLLIDLSSKLKEAYPSSFIGGYSGF